MLDAKGTILAPKHTLVCPSGQSVTTSGLPTHPTHFMFSFCSCPPEGRIRIVSCVG
jgi:hypothetical protein